jgi:hypothetical protein
MHHNALVQINKVLVYGKKEVLRGIKKEQKGIKR